MSLVIEYRGERVSIPRATFPYDANNVTERMAWIRDVALACPLSFHTPQELRAFCSAVWQEWMDQLADFGTPLVGVPTNLLYPPSAELCPHCHLEGAF
jgi:hypothetical protein